jgi:methionyl-tRNA synthetase
MEIKPQITFDEFVKMDLRVGRVVEAEAHPNADRLLKLQVELGELGRRQVCAGIRAFYEPEQLVGRQVVVIVNLAPRTIRGEESNGMVLAASRMEGDQHADVVVLTPEHDVPDGAPVS